MGYPPPTQTWDGVPHTQTWDGVTPPESWTDTHLWKHNLPSYVRTRTVKIVKSGIWTHYLLLAERHRDTGNRENIEMIPIHASVICQTL